MLNVAIFICLSMLLFSNFSYFHILVHRIFLHNFDKLILISYLLCKGPDFTLSCFDFAKCIYFMFSLHCIAFEEVSWNIEDFA